MQQAPEAMTLKVIAHIHTAFPTKFGIPRQSAGRRAAGRDRFYPGIPQPRRPARTGGFQPYLAGVAVFRRGAGKLVSHRAPATLGGNTRVGVFATRSPFRPNPLGLSSVKLEAIEQRPDVGPVLIVRGADLMDGTPIYDIKPYIPYADCHPDAAEGFTGQTRTHHLEVSCPEALWQTVPEADRAALQGVLASDPRPSYQHDPQRVYGMEFAGLEVHFTVDGAQLTVRDITLL